ncbi:TonB-dependent siderophore receptor [Pigmentiphaga litoralis]|uniref:TonB-dependent siderophore receptor n=1 Tax=Pigmentiphaga litoralis TaxID=516702 RepID=UPI003B42E8C8
MSTSTSPARLAPVPLALALAALWAVHPAAAQTPSEPSAAQTSDAPVGVLLPTVEVIGGAATGGTYQPDDVRAAKTDLPLRELPQSVRILSRETLDDLGATRLDDVMDTVAGVSRQHNFGGLWDNVAIRGLPGNENTGSATLLNGFAGNRGFNAPRDLAGVERIEFLKGPAAALYGSSEPGGTLNIVSKRPRWTPAHAMDAHVSSQGFARGALDSTGPLSSSVAYRLNVAAEGGNTFRDYVNSNRQVFAPALTWKLTNDTQLEYVGEVLRHSANLDRGVVAINNRLGAIPRSRFLGEPSDGRMTIKNQTHQLVLSQQWNDTWRSRVGLSYRDTSLDGFSTEASSLSASGILNRQRRFRNYQSHDVGVQAEVQGNFSTGSLKHDLLIGIETFHYTMDTLALRANPTAAAPYAIDIYQPVYGQPQPALLPNTATLERQRGRALYLQDAIELAPQWRLLGGVRVDTTRQSLLNRRTGVTTSQDPTATSPKLGVSWLPNRQWTVYANAGTSFRPNAGADVGARSFVPEEGRAVELGSKWENADQTLGATASLFDIRKRNVLTGDPLNPGFSISAGEVRSRGVEAEMNGQVSRHWRVNASLSVNDVEIRKDNSLEVGGRLLNTPAVTASVMTMYEDVLPNGDRYGLGGGVTHVGKRLGEARTQVQADTGAPAFMLPAYTVARLGAYWRLNPKMRLSVDVHNLFDKTTYASSYNRLWVAPGASRTVIVGLHANF